MMRRRAPFFSMLLGIGLLVGCGSETEPAGTGAADGQASAGARFENLVEYVAEPVIRTEAVKPTGIAVGPDDCIFIACQQGVTVLDSRGTPLRAWATEARAHAIAVDEEGNVYVGLRDRVKKYDSEGNLLLAWGEPGRERGQFRFIASLAVRGDEVYVADAANRAVLRFDITGDFIEEIGKVAESGEANIVTPSMFLGVAARENGEVVIGNPGRLRIERHTPNGRLLAKWGRPGLDPGGFSGCCNPIHIALAGDDRLVTVEKGAARVKMHEMDGTLLAVLDANLARSVAPDEKAGVLGPDCFGGVAVDSRGRILALHPDEGWVWVFRKSRDATKGAQDE